MTMHTLWLWSWFLVGMATYWLKRAYYLVTGPNPIATTYRQFWQRCWIPLLVRGFIDSLAYWVLFTPGMADRALAYFGWSGYSWMVAMTTQVAPFAAIFGHAIDSVMDFVVSKVPLINTFLPQMPGPLPQQAPPDKP